jgi:hypothetical protein
MSLNSGSCWEVLELEATEDKKRIKRAYHKLLRQYKPDEQPKEFKILYQAYQEALEWEEPYDWESEGSDEDFDWDVYWEEIAQEEEEEQKLTPKEEKDLEIIHDAQWQWTRFQEQVDALTQNNYYPEQFNQLKHWKFLEEISSDVLLEGDAGYYLFNAVSEFEERFEDILLNQEVILYMDSIFLWSKYWQNYDQESPIFEYLSTQNAVQMYEQLEERFYPLASLQQRAMAFVLDAIIVVIGILLINSFRLPDPLLLFYIYFIFVGFIFWVLGMRTPAYYFLKLKVLEGDFCDPPTKTARGVRIFLSMLSLIALYWTVVNFSEASWVVFLITGYNISLLLSEEKLIQDISGTRVYDVRDED